MKRDIRGISFDAFGTLVTAVGRSGPYQTLATRARCDPRRFRIDAMTRNLTLAELALELGCGHISEELTATLEAELETVVLYPEVAECLSLLDREGIPYAVCSNLGHGYGRKVVELVPGARGYAMSYEVGAFKPDPRMYAAVADILDAPPSRIFFVGDTRKADYDGPIEFGLRAAHLDRSSGDDLLSVVRRALSDATDNPILNK